MYGLSVDDGELTITGKADGGDTHLIQRFEFARVGDAVLVRILPYAEPVPLRIQYGKNAVAVGIERGQPLQVGLRTVQIGGKAGLSP